VPADTDGVSLLPTLLGTGRQTQHEYLYWEFHQGTGSQAVRLGRWKGIRQGVRRDPNAAVELYDLEADLDESHDRAAEYPAVTARIRALMEASHSPSEVPYWNFPSARRQPE